MDYGLMLPNGAQQCVIACPHTDLPPTRPQRAELIGAYLRLECGSYTVMLRGALPAQAVERLRGSGRILFAAMGAEGPVYTCDLLVYQAGEALGSEPAG